LQDILDIYICICIHTIRQTGPFPDLPANAIKNLICSLDILYADLL